MGMFGYLLEGPNLPFTIALAIMGAIALLEGVAVLLGFGLSSLIDHMLPDADIDFDIDAPDIHGADTALSQVLGWLLIGKVPVLVLLIVFLTVFGLVGLVLQSAVHSISGAFLPGLVAAPISFALSLPLARLSGRGLARVIPRTETSAVSRETFVGRVAVITLGPARVGQPARARLRDQHGRSHNVMVEPDGTEPEAAFETGCEVLLVQSAGVTFKAIRNTTKPLVD